MYEDSSKVKSIQEMHKNVAIRKSDKGNGIVLTDAKYCKTLTQRSKEVQDS